MEACPSCGKELPGEFPFCPFCGAPLAEQVPATVQEERKVVSVLFCDLVGFTAASDTADPEDVRARIRPYHQRLRDVIERFGGTVEKFVGDAVMAVFGAPVAHEDDAERAVRAGLRILEAIDDLNAEDASLALQVRVGINTGEAVVALGAKPEKGEVIVTGDVVNTAARLEGAAPVNGVAVSETTYRATARVFEYEPLEPVAVKGKSEPLPMYRPVAALARFGSDVTRTHATPLVGRELEKPLLIGTFERAAQQQSCQLVTVVGEPGVGKSRLCMELFRYAEERVGLVRWRQGRCLPYGDGIAFWALGEIVKAECGILESDSPDEAQAKLERSLADDVPDRPWLLARLGPLVGLPGEPTSEEESFTAWRRFLEQLASGDEPAVLVFEDLHWGDPALLRFLEHLADWSEGVPLLVLCTARPELHEQHPGWAGGLRNATTINLAPLSDQDTAELVTALLERAVLPPEMHEQLLERAGGNPLYAEEFVRLLVDRGQLDEAVEVPDSVHALIAARLDTLSAERKALLQDAAVVGKVFWVGALVAMGDRDRAEVEQALHELARKELVRVSRTSSMEGEAEYGFWHGLVRDVCYQQIPRAARAERHQRAAAWIEQRAGERVEDLADLLAYHYETALDLSRAAGQTEAAPELEGAAIRYLVLAGERALGLDVEKAVRNLGRALELASPGHPQRGRALERWASALVQQGRLQEARTAREEALDLYRAASDDLAVGRVLVYLSNLLDTLGDPLHHEMLAEAISLLEALPPGSDLVRGYGVRAGVLMTGSRYAEAIAAAEKAIELAARLGLPEPVDALGFAGLARAALGEHRGVEEIRRALELAIDQGNSRDAANLYNNLCYVVWLYEGSGATNTLVTEGIAFSERQGLKRSAEMLAGGQGSVLAETGHTEQALARVTEIADRLEADGDVSFILSRSDQITLLAERGEDERAPDSDAVLAAARNSGQPQLMATAVAAAAKLELVRGNREEARALLLELDHDPDMRRDPVYAFLLPGLVRSALGSGDRELATRLVEGVEPLFPLSDHALATCGAELAEAAGNHSEAARLYADAANRWQGFGNVPERAYALLGQGRSLRALGDPAAEAPLAQARELFASMGYRPALAEIEALLAEGRGVAEVER